MNSLFYLYDDYINIIKATTKDHASESDFKTYTKHCVKKYQELEDKCLKESTSFCKALCDFKKKYESIILSDEIIKDWSERTLPSLSKHENAQVKSPQLSSTLAHPSLADNGISERANRNLLTSSESLERGSEGPVKPGIMTEKMNVTELIVNDGSRSPKEISYIPYNSRQDSSENNEKIEIPKDNDFDIPTNKIIGTSISTVGVSSLFFLFYKVNNK
ncbi:hypothetical protein PVBG_06269 [Plasmodium vivax Brazil I]|uniref:Uncharacterized protein n=1 Tax=Plasmodium vivax (strain Brazil I) TaxID=1033975 RepID=A0A0J9VAZ4_PLAV1|nr:hypothetical protein PVBG_06269 [Plasmodium vivax Brazil I]